MENSENMGDFGILIVTRAESSNSSVPGNAPIIRLEAESSDLEYTTEEINTDFDEYSGSLIGMKRGTVCLMYDLYRKHAQSKGFSVRKSTGILSKDGNRVLTSKLFVCSCTGEKRSRNEEQITTFKRKRCGITRTNCKAQMRVKLTEDRQYEVVKHLQEHNHPLSGREWNHLHRSERAIKEGKAIAIIEMTPSGLRPSDSYRYLSLSAGGEDQIGHTMKDHLNFVHRTKVKWLEGGDAKIFMELIQNQEDEENQFFYRVQMNDEGRMKNIFWRDSMMKEDFDLFGDVMVFDTTYRTNRYKLIGAPFVGINHHWKNTMFGCAFLSDEKTETFEWLFTVFRKSISEKGPTTIFTDQDQAISNAIEKVFPETRHGLYLWHLQQNAVSKFAELKCDDTFKEAFKKCLLRCATEEEFERCWKDMITTYSLENNSYFTRIYSLKDKWCTALSKDFFFAGLLSSQRSESTNSSISFKTNKTTSLTDFWGVFNKVVKAWRAAEDEDNFKNTTVQPESSLQINGMVKHAAEIYTLSLYKKFEREFLRSISCTSTIEKVMDTTMVYGVARNDKLHNVTYDFTMKYVECTCKKFEECGLLCSLCLYVLHINSVNRIPALYIRKRWTKSAKLEVWNRNKGIKESWKADSCIPWRHEMVIKSYNLIIESERKPEARKILEKGYNRDYTAIQALPSEESPEASVDSTRGTTILDPKRTKTKGRSQRIKGHLKKNKKKKKELEAENESVSKNNEFGSRTPNPHLF